MTHVVKLRVNGEEFAGFKGGTISLGLDQLCSAFSFEYHDRRGAENPVPIEEGDRCSLLIDDRVIMDGWVDDSDIEYDAKMYRASVTGRSLTCDLVDCTAMNRPSSWSNAPITAIIADLLNPFGIQARFNGPLGASFAKFKLEKGEKVGDAIARLVRARGLLAYTVGSDLVIERAGTTTTNTVIRTGDQVLRGKRHSSLSQRFSDYHFIGQTRANDTTNGVNAAQLDGHVQDLAVKRYRPLLIVKGGHDSKADLGQIAVLERNQRAGKGERLPYTVRGWEREEGLWLPNIRTRVIDTITNVDCEMLVVNVSYKFAPRDPGYVTELELCRPEAFDVIDYPVRRRRREGIRDSGATTWPPGATAAAQYDERIAWYADTRALFPRTP